MPMPEIDWNVLTPAIKNRRCVLFLGPDAYPFDETQTVEQAMWNNTTQNASLVRKFYADDGLRQSNKYGHRILLILCYGNKQKRDNQVHPCALSIRHGV